MAIEALEGLTDQALFDEANADEAPTETVVAEPEAPAEQPGQARDEAGRPAGKPEPGPETPAVTDQAAKAPVDDSAAMVPSWRVREINEEKRSLADKLAALEAERANWQRQQPPPRPVEPAEKVEKPDPLLDPEGYARSVRDEIRNEIINERREESLVRAREANTQEFDEAYAAALKAVDPALKARMQQSRDPGKTLLEWHRENKTRAEVGTDPNAYFDKRLEAYLADTANQAKVLERIRGGVQPAGNGKPPATSLPPSLTRTAAAATISADDDDISNDGLWRHANA